MVTAWIRSRCDRRRGRGSRGWERICGSPTCRGSGCSRRGWLRGRLCRSWVAAVFFVGFGDLVERRGRGCQGRAQPSISPYSVIMLRRLMLWSVRWVTCRTRHTTDRRRPDGCSTSRPISPRRCDGACPHGGLHSQGPYQARAAPRMSDESIVEDDAAGGVLLVHRFEDG